MPIFAGQLAGALARARGMGREGERERYEREQQERAYQDNLLMRELAMKQQALQQQSMDEWRRSQIMENERQGRASTSRAALEQQGYEELMAALAARGVPEVEARALARDPVAARERLRPAEPQAPRAPVRGTPEYLKAYEAEKQIDARYRPPPQERSEDEPWFLKSSGERDRAARLVTEQTEDAPDGLTPEVAAQTARQQGEDAREAAYQSDLAQLNEYYRQAHDNAAGDPAQEAEAADLFMKAKARLMAKYRPSAGAAARQVQRAQPVVPPA